MKVPAPSEIVPFPTSQPELLDAPISSELDKFVAKARQIAESRPDILRAIENDQNATDSKETSAPS